MAKVFVYKKNTYKIKPLPTTGETEIIEMELDGVVVNRVKRSKEFAQMYAQFFYDKHGESAKVFFIRPSKMNFKSLLTKWHEPE